ncbi:MAG: FtsX-like permease family protein [Christensenellales bacterium]|jgi:ABC-type antimicrobial peptide transport system permease subunit
MLSKLRMVFRTPVRNLALLLLLVAAFGVFAFALSMYTGIQTAVDEVDRNIFSLAYVDENAQNRPYNWQQQYLQEDAPSLIQAVEDSGMLRQGFRQPAQNLSAYSANLFPVMSREFDPLEATPRFDDPYNYGAMIIRVIDIEPQDQVAWYTPQLDAEDYNMYEATHTTYRLRSKIEETLLLNPDFTAPEEMMVYSSVDGADGGSLFVPGRRYLVMGQFQGVMPRTDLSFTNPQYVEDVRKFGLYIDPEDKPTFDIGAVPKNLFTPTTTGIYDPETGSVRYVQAPENKSIIPLKGSGQEPLDSQDRTRIPELLRDVDFNMHSFPVIATDAIQSLFPFHQKSAYISQGRGFSAEDLANRHKVVLVPATMAQKNNLVIGDTLPLSFHDGWFTHDVGGGNGDLSVYKPTGQGYTAEKESYDYEIIGLYSAPLWETLPLSMMANMLIIPSSSLENQYETSLPLSQSFLLENGSGESFLQHMKQAGYGDLFLVDDQNYHQVINGLKQLQQDAGLLLVIGLALFVVVILLFVHLSVRRRQHEAGLLLSLGTSPADTTKGIAAPGLWLILFAVIFSCVLIVAGGSRMASTLLDPDQALGLSAVCQGTKLWLLIGLVVAEGVITALAVWFVSHRISHKQPLALLHRVEE